MTYTKDDIIKIIDAEIKKAMEAKNDYIKLNGYKHADILQRFDTQITTLTALYHHFK